MQQLGLFGLSYRHTTSHMARAVLEGISFNLRMLEETLTENSACPTSIKVTGGFSQSELWLQILADIFELPITVQKTMRRDALQHRSWLKSFGDD